MPCSPFKARARKPARKPGRISPYELRLFLGCPTWGRWKKVLAKCGIETGWSRRLKGRRARTLSFDECRRVMEAYYENVGARRVSHGQQPAAPHP